jgi:TPR repeat protein
MRRFLFAVFLVMACATSVAAGPREDAFSAYDRGDYTLAARLIRSLAEQGDALAQGTLGVMYQEGQGVPQNSQEAEKWFRKASEQGEVHSQHVLGKLYDEGKGVPQDYQEAVKWYRKAAEQGLAAAQSDLGVMYEKGQGVPQDAQEAVKWYRMAAGRGIPQAQHNLGLAYQLGRGVPQDVREAVEWFRKAAEQGIAQAQFNLGAVYYLERGVPRDIQEAAKWFRKAAEQGLPQAQSNLGVMYEKGQGVPQDAQEAAKWFRKAAEQGVAQAKTTRVTNPYRSVDGVLVIAGEGLNSAYYDISLSAMVFIFSVKVSESLCDEIVRAGTSAECYINRDKAAEPISYVGPLILKNKRDGLAQVFVQHTKNEQENAVYLTVTYTPLFLQKDGSSVVGEAYSERYILHEAPSASDLARDFAQKLVSRGYIGNE